MPSHLEVGADGGAGAEAGCEAGPVLDDDGSAASDDSLAAAAAGAPPTPLLLLPSPMLAAAAFDLPPRGIVSSVTSERSPRRGCFYARESRESEGGRAKGGKLTTGEARRPLARFLLFF